MASEDDAVYKPKDAISASIRSTMILGGAGLFVSGVQNSLTRQNVTGWGVLTRTGGTIGTFGKFGIGGLLWYHHSDPCSAAMGGTFEFARIAAANLREKEDSWNPAIGGFFAGGIAGFRCQLVRKIPYHSCDTKSPPVRSFPAVLGFGALLAILQGAFEFTGGKLSGYERDRSVDEYERKEQLRKNRRRPIEETLKEMGEGRGKIFRRHNGRARQC